MTTISLLNHIDGVIGQMKLTKKAISNYKRLMVSFAEYPSSNSLYDLVDNSTNEMERHIFNEEDFEDVVCLSSKEATILKNLMKDFELKLSSEEYKVYEHLVHRLSNLGQ